MTNFIFDLITLSLLLIGTPSSPDRYSTLRCRAALGSDTLSFFSFFFFFFWCLQRTIAFFFSLQSASCDTWERVCCVGIAGFTYLLISVQVGRQRASPPSSHLKQERRRTRRIRAGKDDECHNSKSSRYLKAKYFNQPSSNSEPSLPSPLLPSPLLSSPLLSSPPPLLYSPLLLLLLSLLLFVQVLVSQLW